MLVTVQSLKDFMKITKSDHDQFLTVVIQEAQSILDNELGRVLESGGVITYDFSGKGNDRVFLKNRPITAVSQVLVSIDSASEITSDGYEYFDEQGIVQLKANLFPKGVKNCRIKYTAGYSVTTCPAAIKLALQELAKLIYDGSNTGDNRLGKQSITQQTAGTTSYIHDLPARTKRMLSGYRNLSF